MGFQDYARVLVAVFLLYFLHSAGLPAPTLVAIGVFLVLLFFLRGPLFAKIDGLLVERFKLAGNLPPMARRLLVILVFVVVYVVFKQAVFELLKAFGIDIQQDMYRAVNSTLDK
ncbi:MAG: hypothetical protein V1787_01645 [Candidatus Micrarchaeota archaeon]